MTPAPPATPPAAPRRRAGWRVGVALAAGAAAVLGLRAWVIEPVRAESTSMAPTLATGERVLVEKVSLRLRDPRRGELVVFADPADGAATLKRVVGVPGDTVAILDARLHVNDAPVAEPYVDLAAVDGLYYGPVRVPPGTVLVMGDNRADSIDSRHYGPIARSALLGTVRRLDGG